MTPERWEQIDRLFHRALDCEPGQRFAFLAQECAGDEPLRVEVESLISAYEEPGDFIETPAADIAAELLAAQPGGLMPGQTVGHYRIVNLLGEGGMGKVYLADDTKLRRKVALKLLPPEFTINEDRVRRFEQEARAASALNHPNIVTIYEIAQTNSTHFIATEFVDGETLRDHLADARMSVGEVLDVAAQVGSALAAAHQAGIVHRDVKPENIMLRQDRIVKVLDFGLAKLATTCLAAADDVAPTIVKTSPGVVLGTIAYMSPEQARGSDVDARTDIWSLGVVLYELLTGRTPFEGETPSHVTVSILEKEPSPLAERAPQVPIELERIITKALAKDRDERYQSAKDLVTDLKDLKQELDLRTKLNAAGAMSEHRPAVDTDRTRAKQTGALTSARALSGVENLFATHAAKWRLSMAALFLLVVTAAIAFFLINSKKSASDVSRASEGGMKRIAVLPFRPLVGDSRNEALELGMADTLINKLSPLKQLIVWPLSDVRKYRGLEQNPVSAGRELGVDYVLEGTLHMASEGTRVNWRLLSVNDGSAVWADKCDQQCSSVFELQDRIAGQIARALALRLSAEEQTQVTKHYTESPEAYQLYALGMSEMNLKKRAEYLERAIKIDPNYALAYARLFGAYFGPATRGFYVPEGDRQRMEWAAMKAAELDDTLALAHVQLAHVRKYYWDWAAADKEFIRAMELDPNSFEGNSLYSAFLVDVGRLDEALIYARRADEVNPRTLAQNLPGNPSVSATFEAYVYYHMRQYDKAIELWTRGKKSKEPVGSFQLAEAYVANGMYDQAVLEMEKAVINREPQRWDGAPILAFAYAKAGKRDEAMRILDEQNRLAKQGYISPYNFAIIYTGLGEKDRAFEYLNKACEENAQPIYHFPSRPMFDSLHSDPRYAELVRKMNLPQFAR